MWVYYVVKHTHVITPDGHNRKQENVNRTVTFIILVTSDKEIMFPGAFVAVSKITQKVMNGLQ